MTEETLVVNGVEFKNKGELLTFLGIAESTFDFLLSNGMTIDEAANEAMVKMRGSRSNRNYVWEGRKYHGLREISKVLGLPMTTIRNRYERGVDMKVLFRKKGSRNYSRYFEFNGISYRNLTAFLESCGLDVTNTAKLVKDEGYDLGYLYKKNLMEQFDTDYGKEVFPDGYTGMQIYAEMNNLELSHVEMNFIMKAPLHLRFNTLDIYDYHGIELARKIGYLKDGEYVHSAKSVAEAFGVTIHNLQKGIKMGFSTSDVLIGGKIPIVKETESGIKPIVSNTDKHFTEMEVTFNGKTYPNYELLALDYGVSLQDLKSRLDKGRTLNEALGVFEW